MSLSNFGIKRYITSSEEKKIKDWSYKGGSSSFLYERVWSPLCLDLVKHNVPKWLAPNLITFICFSQLVVVHFITLYISPNLDGVP